ncbi:MAG: dTMP kinase [Myxococcota bacterium]
MSRGRFIVLEGLDGAGTTTQCAAIARVFRSEGVEVHVTMEPSPGPIGSFIRQVLTGRVGLPANEGPLTPETMALLFAADRVDHLAAEIEPALAQGALVLSDRYLLSSLAYQGAQVGAEWVAQLNARARKPDLTLFLNVDAEVAAYRRESRGGRPELYEAAAVQRRTAAAYRKAIALRRKAGERVLVIDGNASPAAVTGACVAAIREVRRRRA